MVRRIPLIIVALHTLMVLAVLIFVASKYGDGTNRDIAILWVVFMLVDFPLGWLAIPLEVVARPYFSLRMSDVYLPALTFSVLGGIQYFFLTLILLRIRCQILRNRRKRKGLCVNCEYALRGLTESRCPECGTPFDPKLLEKQGEERK